MRIERLIGYVEVQPAILSLSKDERAVGCTPTLRQAQGGKDTFAEISQSVGTPDHLVNLHKFQQPPHGINIQRDRVPRHPTPATRYPLPDTRIIVGGASSGCGKTAAACLLLGAFPGWAAVKVTPCRRGEVCPFGDECGACEPPEGAYEVIADPAIVARPGKDTARLLAAGASRAIWVRSLPDTLPKALDLAFRELADAPGVLVESTTAIPLLGGLRILVAREGVSEIKESARRCAGLVDLMALNRDANCLADTRAASDSLASSLISYLSPRQVVYVCAALSPDDPANQQFVAACRQAII